VPVIALLGLIYLYATGGRYVVTENAYVKSDVITISADVSGRVVHVAVEENQRVRKGDLLFLLDAAPYEIEVQRAESEMDIVATDIESLRADYRETLIKRKHALEQVDFLSRQLKRQRQLRKQGLGSEEHYDEALHTVETAKQQVQLIKQSTERVLATLGGDVNRPIESHPDYRRARATHNQAALNLARTKIVAATSGIITNLKLQTGEFVAAGKPVFSLVDTTKVWADAYPDQIWETIVDNIAPATGAEFALLPPQNASGNWVKVVQWVPIRLDLDPQATKATALRAGMTVTVRIDTERHRAMPAFIQTLFGNRDLLSMAPNIDSVAKTSN
jgi:membrane fusion protein (multidrug efflux system)